MVDWVGGTVLDADGEVVVLSTQVGLVVSASRNVGRGSSRSCRYVPC